MSNVPANPEGALGGSGRTGVMVRYRENLGFLARSAQAFDAGDHAEALRLATTVRNLSYDEGYGDSILKQIGAKPAMLWQSSYVPFAMEVPEGTPIAGVSLYGIALAADGSTYLEPLDFGPDGREVSYDDWWAVEPVVQFGDSQITRRQLVLGLANQDGGAHVDLTGNHIAALFAASPELVRPGGGPLEDAEQLAFQRDLLQVQMRTVANEVHHSITNAERAGLIRD